MRNSFILRNQLSKSPRVLVDSLDIREHGYENAKELLEKAFGSDLPRKYDVIKRLANIKLNLNGDPYVFIGEIISVINSFDNLEINVTTVLQYFIWTGLNQKFQNHLINITNVAKPSLDQIETHIFEATERYVRQGEQQKAKAVSSDSNKKDKVTTALATNVNVGRKESYKVCILCEDDGKSNIGHVTKDCPIYKTANQKVVKLRYLKACTRCSYRNHTTKDCRFKFGSKCRQCGGNHFTYPCVSVGKKTKDSEETSLNKKKFQYQ